MKHTCIILRIYILGIRKCSNYLVLQIIQSSKRSGGIPIYTCGICFLLPKHYLKKSFILSTIFVQFVLLVSNLRSITN